MVRKRDVSAGVLALMLGGCAANNGSRLVDRTPLSISSVRHSTTASGLAFHVIRRGPAKGLAPIDGQQVTFDYEGKLLNGKIFDSSFARGEAITGRVGQFVPGFNEALKLMRPGDEWIVWIPPALGYGAEPVGQIPANSTLRFRMALRSVSVPTP